MFSATLRGRVGGPASRQAVTGKLREVPDRMQKLVDQMRLLLDLVDDYAEGRYRQSELSRLESRAHHRVSTLRRYVQALGGEIEIAAVFGKRRVKLTVG